MERFLTYNVSVSNGNLQYPIGKSIFAVSLALKLFRANVANANTKGLKSLYTLFDTYLDYMLAKFELNYSLKCTKIELLDEKLRSFKTIFCVPKKIDIPTRVTMLKVAPNMVDPTRGRPV